MSSGYGTDDMSDLIHLNFQLTTGSRLRMLVSLLMLFSTTSVVSKYVNQSRTVVESVGCPPTCECYVPVSKIPQLKKLNIDCSGRNLTKIPDVSNVEQWGDSHSGVYEMDFKDNNIRNIPEEIPGFGKLKFSKLSLSNNDITNLACQSLISAGVEDLDLSMNPSLEVDGTLFKGYTIIKKLTLNNMGLTRIPREAIAKLKNLTELHMKNNLIKKVQQTDLKGLDSLTLLDLENNSISQIQQEAFKPMAIPRFVNLNSNSLNDLSFHRPCTTKLQLSVLNNPLRCDCDLYKVSSRYPFIIKGTCTSTGGDTYTLQVVESKQLSYSTSLMKLGREMCKPTNVIDTGYNCACQRWTPLMTIEDEYNDCLAKIKDPKSRGHDTPTSFLTIFIAITSIYLIIH